MNKTLTEFIGGVKNGLAKATHYDVFIPKPKVVTSNLFSDSTVQKILLFCEQTQLPGVNMSTTGLRVYGEAREMPYEKLYDPINLSFYVDKDMRVKMFFDEWMGGIQNQYSRTMNYYRDYTVDLTIIMYDSANIPKYSVTLYEAYPKALNAIDVGYANKDVMKVGVTMMYKYWRASVMTTVGGDNLPVSASVDISRLPPELQTVGRSGITIPSNYFDNISSFQQSIQQGITGAARGALNNAVGNVRSSINTAANNAINQGVNNFWNSLG